MFFTAHTVRDSRASLSHRANERRTCYRFFDFWPWRAYPRVKGHQKGRPTVHQDLPSYKISARSRKRCSRYALPKLFSLWRCFLTPRGHPRSNVTVPIESRWVLRLSGPRGPTGTVFEIFRVKILTVDLMTLAGLTPGPKVTNRGDDLLST